MKLDTGNERIPTNIYIEDMTRMTIERIPRRIVNYKPQGRNQVRLPKRR
jgi:hypothetical protein